MCHGTTNFYGISIRPDWLRWIRCEHDDVFIATNQFGNPVVMTKKLPKEAYFVQFKPGRD